MKTVLKNTKRILAVMLAFALVVLAVPDTALLAAEGDRYSLDETTGEYVADENGAYVEDAEGNITEIASSEENGENVTLSNLGLGASHANNIVITESLTNVGSITYSMGTVEESGVKYLNEGAAVIAGTILPKDGYELPESVTFTTSKDGVEVVDDGVATLSEGGDFAIVINGATLADGGELSAIDSIVIDAVCTPEAYSVSKTSNTSVILVTGDTAPTDAQITDGEDVTDYVPTYSFDFYFWVTTTTDATEASYEITSVKYKVGSGSAKDATYVEEATVNGQLCYEFCIPMAEIKGDVEITIGGEVTTYEIDLKKSSTDKGVTINESTVEVPHKTEIVLNDGDEFTLKTGYELDTENTKVYNGNSDEVEATITGDSITIAAEKVTGYLSVALVTKYKSYSFDSATNVGTNVAFDAVSGIEDGAVSYNTPAVFTLTIDEDEYILTDMFCTIGGKKYDPTLTNTSDPVEGVVTYTYKINGTDIIGDIVLYAVEAENTDLSADVTVTDATSIIKSITYVTSSEPTEKKTAALDDGKIVAPAGDEITVTITKYATKDGALKVKSGTKEFEVSSWKNNACTVTLRSTAALAANGVQIDTAAYAPYQISLPTPAAVQGGKVYVSVDGGSETVYTNGKSFKVPAGSSVQAIFETPNTNFTVTTGTEQAEVTLTEGTYDDDVTVTSLSGNAYSVTYVAKASEETGVLEIIPSIEFKSVEVSASSAITYTVSTDNVKTLPDASYAAASGASKKWVTGTSESYIAYTKAMADTSGFQFTAKAVTGYAPQVTYSVGGEDQGVLAPISSTTAGVCTYLVPKASITGNVNIAIEAVEVTHGLTISDAGNHTTIDVYVDNARVNPVGGVYPIREGATATVNVAAKSDSEAVTSAYLGTKKLSTKATGFTTTVKMGTEDQTLVINSDGVLVLNPVLVDSYPLSGTKNTYKNVPYETELILSAMYGGEAATIDSSSVVATDKKALNGTTITDGTLKIAKEDGGRTLTASLTFSEVSGTYSYTITATKGLDKIAVAGTKYDKSTDTYTLSQAAGTYKTYKVTSKTSGAALDSVNIKVDKSHLDTDEVDVTYLSGALTIEVMANELTAGTGTIELYDDINDDDSLDDGEELEGGKFTLSVSASPVIAAKKPLTMKQTLSEDVAITVDLSLPSEVSSLVTSAEKGGEGLLGNLYYVVTAIPEDETTYETFTTAIPVTGTKQSEKLAVLKKDGSAVTPGEGAAQRFSVAAWLVQDVEEETTYPDDIETIAAAETTNKKFYVTENEMAFRDSTGKGFYTKAPAYASKVTLTKKEGTIYAGSYGVPIFYKNVDKSGNIILAKVKADSAATVTNFKVVSATALTDNENNEVAIASWLEINENDELVLNNAGRTALPSLKLGGNQSSEITVSAGTPDGSSQVAYATLKVNFVARTLDIEIAENGGKFFKQTGKALNITPTLNADTTYAYSTKANNRFSWSLMPIDDDDDSEALVSAIYAAKGFNSSTGKITIPAGYVFPAQTVSFKLVAASVYSDANGTATITVTDTAVSVGELVFGTVDSEGDLRVLAKNGSKDTVTMADIFNEDDDLPVFVLLKSGASVSVGSLIEDYATSEMVVKTTDTAVIYTNGSSKIALLEKDSSNGYEISDLYSDGTINVTAKAQDTGKTVKMALKVSKAALTAKEGFFTIGDDTLASVATNGTGVDASNYAARYKLTAAAYEAASERMTYGNVMEIRIGYVDYEKENDYAVHELDDYYGTKLTVSGAGAKIMDSDAVQGVYQLLVSAPTFKVKVDRTTYTITDTAFENVEEKDTKTTVKGTVYETAADSSYQKLVLEKTIGSNDSEITDVLLTAVTNAKTGLPDEASIGLLAALKEGSVTDAVSVVTDLSGSVEKDLDTGKMVTTVGLHSKELAAGSYSFYVTYVDSSGNALTKPQLVTLKIAAAPKFSAKTAYTTTYTDTDKVEPVLFTASNMKSFPESCDYELVNLENLNTKGSFSNFATIFSIADDDLQIEVEAGNLAALAKATAKDLTGNVYYTVNGIPQKPVKITITITESPKIACDQVMSWNGDQTSAGFAVAKKTDKITSAQVIASLKDVTENGYYFPSNIKIVQSAATSKPVETLNGDEVQVVSAKYKTLDQYADGTVPSFLYVAPTDEEDGYVAGVLAISTSAAIADGETGYTNKDISYLYYQIPVVLDE